jgi:hypothetical protein
MTRATLAHYWEVTDMSTAYTLERTLPDGQVKTQGPTTRRGACGLAACVLTDNLGVSRSAALTLAHELHRTPAGRPVEAYGYTFRIVPESAA